MPINPRNEAAENRELLELFDCVALIVQARSRFAAIGDRPGLPTVVCLDELDGGLGEVAGFETGRRPAGTTSR